MAAGEVEDGVDETTVVGAVRQNFWGCEEQDDGHHAGASVGYPYPCQAEEAWHTAGK